MKKDGKYRFSLQFPSDTEEQIQAGELLERAGNRKSAIIVDALNSYIAEHPELLAPRGRIEVQTTARYDRDEIVQMIRKVVDERLSSLQYADKDSHVLMPESDDLDEDISQMLDNLDLFQ